MLMSAASDVCGRQLVFMERWSGILKVSLHPNSSTFYKVAASLCLSPSTKTLTVGFFVCLVL